MKSLNKAERESHLLNHSERDRGAVSNEQTRAIVVVPVWKGADSRPTSPGFDGQLSNTERLSEAIGLASAIGLDIRFSGLVNFVHPRPATLLGAGKVNELAAIVKAEDAAVVIIDHKLTPIQQRNLEKALNAKVLDRTGLILEIFASRAQSKEGRLQVELARLTYQKSRLVRSWTHLERQRGGFGFLGGPGETQIEADRRVIGERIDAIRSDLDVVERTRRLHRKRRKSARQQIVSLVGYTNAGKSTLFNALSGAGVLAKDMLFATLDPTLRRIEFPGGGAFILSDTVGFISDLPTQLIAAFRATLEEVLEADLVLHVRDIVSPASEAQRVEVQRVLAEVGIDSDDQAKRVIEVWNKADLLPAGDFERLSQHARHRVPPAIVVSAAKGQGVSDLTALIQTILSDGMKTRDVVVDQGNGPLIHWIHENTQVLDKRFEDDGSLHFHIRLASERMEDLDRHIKRAAI